MWPDTFQSIKEMLTKGNAKRINKNFVFVSEMSGMSEGHFYKVLKSEKPDVLQNEVSFARHSL